MIDAFRAEWVRLARARFLVLALGASGLLSFLLSWRIFTSAGDGQNTGGRPGLIGSASVADLSAANGATRGLAAAGALLGVIAVCVFAASFAGDFGTGMLRNLLIRQPRRIRLVVGKLAALCTLTLAIVAVAAVFGIAAAALRPADVDASAWISADGLLANLRAVGEVALATIGYGLVGAILGVLCRSVAVSIAVGVAWLLPVESILGAAVSDTKQWLPGQALTAIAGGGNATIGLGAACALVAAYLAVAGAVTLRAFVQRDVAV
jgi:ABC-2 type transport system permease protein